MPTIQDIRQQYPQYADMSDVALADSLYKKFYSDMPRDKFNEKIGLDTSSPRSGALNTVLQGATFGLSDEASAAGSATARFIRSLIDGKSLPESWAEGGKAYDKTIRQERANVEQFKIQNPILGPGLEVLGGFAGAAPRLTSAIGGPLSVRQLLGGQGGVLRDIAPEIGAASSPMTTAQAAAQGAKIGATGGAVAGFGSGEGGLENRLTGAAIGATAGATLGGGLPLAANLTGRFGGRVLDAVGLRNPEEGATRQVLRAFERDAAAGGPSIDDVAMRIALNRGELNRPEFIPDMAGENVKRLAAMSTQTPGAARQAAQAAIEARTAMQGERVADDVSRLVSPNSDFHGTLDALMKRRAADAKPLYEAAFAKGSVYDKSLERLAADPIVQQGARFGIRTQQLEALAGDVPFDPKAYGAIGFNDAGDPILGPLNQWSLRTLDAAKRGIDSMLESYRNPVTGKLALDERGRAIDAVRRSLIQKLDDMTGGADGLYAQARKAWSGPSQSMDALARGRSVFNPDSEVTAKMVGGMSPSDKEFFLAGVARAIRDRVENSADGRNAVAAFFGKESFREKLRAAFPSDQAYNRFSGLMQRETRMFQGQREYGPRAGSSTARNLADQADAMIDPPGGVLSALMTGNVGGAARLAAADLLRRGQGMNSATADKLAPMLFNPDQPANAQTILGLLSARGNLQRDQISNQALGGLLTRGTGVAVGTQTDQRRQ